MRLLYVVAVCFAVGAVGTVGCGKPKGGTTTGGKGGTTGAVTPATGKDTTGKDVTGKETTGKGMTGKGTTGKETGGKETGGKETTGKATGKATAKETTGKAPADAKGSVKIDKIDDITIKKGASTDVTVKLARTDYTKALKVEASLDTDKTKGVAVKTSSVDVKADESTAKITLTAEKTASGEGELTITVTGEDLKKSQVKANVKVEK